MPQQAETSTTLPKHNKGKVATICSCILWVTSIALSFAIPASSKLIWLPDSILLAGFIPLLFIWRPSWPWIVFGLLNVAIGFFLITIDCLADAEFPADLQLAKQHLKIYHPGWSWMIIGTVCTGYGIGRAIKNIFYWLRNKLAKSDSNTETQN